MGYYEELDLATDEEDVGSDDVLGFDTSMRRSQNGLKGKRKVSSYIQRKHQDDPDVPDELPTNYKDSRRHHHMPPRPGPAARAKSTHMNTVASPQPDDPVDEDAENAGGDVGEHGGEIEMTVTMTMTPRQTTIKPMRTMRPRVVQMKKTKTS